MYAIEAANLSRVFDDKDEKVVAVENLNLQINRGEVFGFLGPNGAGKTTTIRMLCSLISPTTGDAFINGMDVKKDGPSIRKVIGISGEPSFYFELSALRNLEFFADMYKVPKTDAVERIEYFMKMFDLWDEKDKNVGTYSKGMKQRLSLIRAMVHDPDVLFLDEPTSSLDPESGALVRNYIMDLRKKGKTIFICTHNMYEAERVCDRFCIFNKKSLYCGKIGDRIPGKIDAKISLDINGAVLALGHEAHDGYIIVKTSVSDLPELIKELSDLTKVYYVSEMTTPLERLFFEVVK